MKRSAILLPVALLIFTACSSGLQSGTSNSTPVGKSFGGSVNSGGNGEFYDGKPDPGLYLRTLPGDACGSKTIGEVLVTDFSIHAKSTDPKTCRVTTSEISPRSVEVANYNRAQLGLAEGIYARDGATGGVVEAWCRSEDSNSITGFDVLIQANYATRTYTARVSSQDKAHEPLSILRLNPKPEMISKRGVVKYASANDGFQLAIEPKTYDPVTGKMKALFQYKMLGFDVRLHWFCRLGGELDMKSLKPSY